MLMHHATVRVHNFVISLRHRSQLMNRIEINPAVRHQASVVDQNEVIAVHPRDLIQLIDIVNFLVDDYKMRLLPQIEMTDHQYA